MEFYIQLQQKLKEIVKQNNLYDENIFITTNTLTPEEAIGITERKDFPLLNGKEVLIESNFLGSVGQAYTDSPTVFNGSIKKVLELDLSDNRNKVLFIAALNAILKHLKFIENTIHCKDEEPEECGKEVVKYIKDKFGNVKIGMVGFQPAIIDNLRREFSIRVLDLDPRNIDKTKYDVLIEDGKNNMEEVVNWADILVVTGSTITNGTIVDFLKVKKPILFYGTTIAGVAYLEGLSRICFCSK
ncbi:Putative heavy-metal chelation [Tissierella praeacuta DSM 18095]|uniref:Putative heavy-metal chelation n=1 Tax=Tissierella praeacuta DSM 18095 TaxID=1123404 RepID=A0A1M4VLV1_9FIRM|nr:DUF364 domain-containing protein [Tissierella praeacuta]SHE70004.1 Putative heavy-metal chelation [Tissierella praeacuta DSM 18095]SUO99033.1 Domain of uncharacterised function (DUF364) [Tissierella praeacuta]